jgi:hypothetical protein
VASASSPYRLSPYGASSRPGWRGDTELATLIGGASRCLFVVRPFRPFRPFVHGGLHHAIRQAGSQESAASQYPPQCQAAASAALFSITDRLARPGAVFSVGRPFQRRCRRDAPLARPKQSRRCPDCPAQWSGVALGSLGGVGCRSLAGRNPVGRALQAGIPETAWRDGAVAESGVQAARAPRQLSWLRCPGLPRCRPALRQSRRSARPGGGSAPGRTPGHLRHHFQSLGFQLGLS